MSKPTVAIFDFTGCEGCQLQIINLEEELLDFVSIIHPSQWREAASNLAEGQQIDIAIIEGSITRSEDEERLKKIRGQAKILIALGSCAALGGINKSIHDVEQAKQFVYGDRAYFSNLESSPPKALDEVVKVDYKVYGCPIDRREFVRVIRSLAIGKRPEIPDYPVCVECKQRENVCRYSRNELCLGPVTRAGCGARCPSAGSHCYGCRGFLEDSNISAARAVATKLGKHPWELEDKLSLFGRGKEYIHEERDQSSPYYPD